jgi:hypothetical protein
MWPSWTGDGLLFAGTRGAVIQLPTAMRNICQSLGVEPATPHDLRRTHGTLITRSALVAMPESNSGSQGRCIASVYDRPGGGHSIQARQQVGQVSVGIVDGPR